MLLTLLVLALQHMPGVPDHYVSRKAAPSDSGIAISDPATRLVTAGVFTPRSLDSLSAIRECSGGDLEWAIARAFGWRPAGSDAPAAWRAEAQRRLGATPAKLDVSSIARACEKAARISGFALDASEDASFRRSLLTGLQASNGSVRGRTMLGIVANARFPVLRVLETTDFHGAMIHGGRDGKRVRGGAAVVAAYVARLRAENPEGTVLIDGGDIFQGTMISNLSFGRAVVDHMNQLGYTAAVIGNHEFDWSADTLVNRIHEMRFAALGANIRERASGKRPAWARADTVVTRRGVRLGIFGLSYQKTPTTTLARNVAHLQFDDHVVTAKKLVPELVKRADIVIGVGHIPGKGSVKGLSGGDLRELGAVRGVVAWFGGHSHNEILDSGSRPVFAIAGSQGRTIAVCDLVVDPIADRVLSTGMSMVTTWADAVTPDSASAALVTRWNQNVEKLADTPLGHNARPLRRNREGESPLGSFVADAIRKTSSTDIAFQNSGGLRADLDAGVITRGAIYEVMPFDNQIVTLELTGAEVRRALEQGLATGRVTQVSGVRYAFDPKRQSMKRITELTLDDGSPLDNSRRYRIAINDFMATGGDDYAVLRQGQNRKETGVLIREAMETYVTGLESRGEKLDYREDGRIRAVPKPIREASVPR